jgi:hypothetical protein
MRMRRWVRGVATSTPSTRGVLGVLSGIIVGGILMAMGGVTGIAFTVVAATAWWGAPPVFAVILGQAGLAAITAPPYSPLVWVAEGALVVLLLGDPHLKFSLKTASALLGLVTLLTVVTWVAVQQLPRVGATTLLTVSAVLVYGVHRYEVVRTGKLDTQNE